MSASYVIFGGAGGIGAELCRRLRKQNHQVLIAGRDQRKLESLAEETGARFQACDATRSAAVDACLEQANEQFGALSGVANCVGSLLLKPAHLTSDDEWRATLDINLNSSFYILRAAARLMKPTGGSIVLVSSAAALTGFFNHEAIAAAKAGIIGLALSAASTYAAQNIRVNCVAPGLTQTPLTAKLVASEPSRKASTAMHALGRLGEPAHVASAIQWLLEPDQSWVTGQVLGIDGGLSRVRPRPQV